jgi:hypothetical protein
VGFSHEEQRLLHVVRPNGDGQQILW